MTHTVVIGARQPGGEKSFYGQFQRTGLARSLKRGDKDKAKVQGRFNRSPV